MDTDETARRRAHRQVCTVFDDCVADDSARGRRDAALISVLYGAEVAGRTAVALPRDAYDASTGVLTWPAGTSHPAGEESSDREARSEAGVHARRAVSGAREALEAWLEVRGDGPGPLLCRVGEGGKPVPEPLSVGRAVRILEERARLAGMRTWPADAARRLYDSPWWEEVPGEARPG